MLLGYLAAALNFPLPAIQVVGGGQAFPCQSHACGCQSAAQCWQSCCCFSHEQKLAWADQQGVELPAGVASAHDSESAQGAGNCCGTASATSERLEVESEARPGYVLSFRAYRCRGLAAVWSGLGDPVDLPPAEALWQPAVPCAQASIAGLPLVSACRAEPPVPPG